MTTTAAERTAVHSGEREKAEKRRALGRGLASLFGGPRVVAGAAAHPSPTAAGAESIASTSPAPTPTQHEPGVVGMIPAAVQESSGATVASPSLSKPAALTATTESHLGGPALVPEVTSSQQDITIFAPGDSRIAGNLVLNLAIENIDRNPFQTRYVENDTALEELTNSIRANGVLQPIVVRPAQEEGRYTLILGERRLHASKLAGKAAIPAMVRRVSEQQAAEMTIIENLQREDLSPLEQAEAFRVLSEEFKLTQAQIGERVGLSRESVANYMRLLRLPEPTKELLARGQINFAMAKELLKLESHDQITKTAEYAVKHGLTFDQLERLVWRTMGVLDPGQERKRNAARSVDPNVRAAQMELEQLLAVRVRIRDRKGKGRIVIEYSTVDDYERVVGMLRGK